ncbi:hypothetical protein [Absidia glauca]|uniref:BZIP domain-containing protein n=1 Tax=Absidia glauca TaxID=4829 RepID=A0A163JJA9_ABSGL|nr:hypothetical protein [Absidia glauca]
MSEINFEYFDPELELCTFDEQGRPIRPRKKPGRKPNPPTPAQRKAQNRAAQRAFRERKRREMRDNEVNIKKCLHQRDQAIRKANTLQRSIKQLRYENNYLKGCLLTLKLACFSHGINVPKFWNTGETDAVGADILSLSKTEGMPQCLEFFLDNNMHIISKSPEFLAPSTDSSTKTDTCIQGYQPPPQQQQQSSRTKPTSVPPMPFVKNDDILTNTSYIDQGYQQSLNDSQFVSRLDPSLYSPVIMPDFITQSLPSPHPPQQEMHMTPSPNTNDILTLLGLSTKSSTASMSIDHFYVIQTN